MWKFLSENFKSFGETLGIALFSDRNSQNNQNIFMKSLKQSTISGLSHLIDLLNVKIGAFLLPKKVMTAKNTIVKSVLPR